jgi:thiol-disulfide isomerase/thioredoxin
MIRVFLFLFLGWTFTTCSSSEIATPETPELPEIEIKINGGPAGKTILVGIISDQQFTADTATMNSDGVVIFEREKPFPTGLYYVLMSNNSSFAILLDNDQTMKLESELNQLTDKMVVKGNLSTDLYYQNQKYEDVFQANIQPINSQLATLSQDDPEYSNLKAKQEKLREDQRTHLQQIFDDYPDSFFTKFKRAAQNPQVRDIRLPDGSIDQQSQVYQYRMEFWDNVDFSNDDLLRTPVIFNKLKRYINELTIQHQDSIIASTDHLVNQIENAPETFKFITNWIALKYEPGKTPIMDGEAILVHIIQNYFTREKAFWADSMTVYGLQQRASEMEASLVGKKGPDVISTDQYGQQKSIYEIDAPYIIVFLYNPTCDHCIEETPQLVKFYREWKPKGVEVFAIAIDTNPNEWKDFIVKNNMDWINVYDPTNRSIYGKYYVDNTPELYVLNKDRIIIAKNLKPNQATTVIERDIAKQ